MTNKLARWTWLPALILVAFSLAAPGASAQHATSGARPKLQPGTATVYRPAGIDWGLVHWVYDRICKAGIREPKIVMQQAILETGWFRSPSLMNLNNLFGFRHVRYLSFESLEDSIQYYKSWQDARLQESDSNYFTFLERIRYGAPGYTRHVKKIEWNEECPPGQ